MPYIMKKDFGKKMKRPEWGGCYFIPLAFSYFEFDKVIGEYWFDDAYTTAIFDNDFSWVGYEEPKKKVIKRMAPALCLREGTYYISTALFETKEEAIRSHDDFAEWARPSVVKFPANDTSWVEVEVEE